MGEAEAKPIVPPSPHPSPHRGEGKGRGEGVRGIEAGG